MVITAILVLVSILLIILLTSVVKLNAFVSLFIVSLLLALTTVPFASVVTVLKDGFGSTMASIGFLIIFGAIIAVVLDKSGGAIAIATAILRKTGTKNAAAAMGITGFVTGMPIFCDSGFIILSGLAKSFSAKTKIAMPFIAIVLATSLYSVHCLVPTHPGALAAAGLLKVDIGTLILVGTLFAFPAAIAAFYWTKWRTHAGLITHKEDLPEVETIEDQKLPSVFLSLLPIVIPLLLISLNSLLTAFGYKNQNSLIIALIFVGQPVIALFTGMLLSLLLIGFRKMETINGIFESAIVKAGPILIVTAAGGMFGMVIKETGVGAYAGEVLVKTGLGLAVPFLFAFLLKTAQGSSTVAIITASSFIAPMLPALGLDSETGKIMTMVVLGAGSMMISHANDSYFWVITRFSNLQTDTTLKIYSSATIVMGVTVFVCALIASKMVL